MDDSTKERRKSVKSRRRSLRNLQPIDVGTLAVDQVESFCDAPLVGHPMYGSVWIEQTESPALVRKPRRSISCSQISQNLANSVIRSKNNVCGKEHLEKENFSPDSSPLKMVEDTPKRTPVLHPVRTPNSPPGNCSVEDDLNQETSYEEIGVPRFGHRTLDGSVSEDSLVGTISILSIDESDLRYQDQMVDHSVEDELQVLLDSFSKKEPNKIGMENMTPSPDQITDPATSFVEESAQPSLDCLLDSVRSGSRSPDGIVCEIATPDSSVEAQIFNDSLPVFSRERISNVSDRDSPPFSIELFQDFQQLDISETDVTADSDSESSDVETLHENTLDPSLTSNETLDTSLLHDSSLDQSCTQHSDSWCFIKCFSDEESSDVSTLIDSSLSDGCDIWETDLSSAGSELSDSWCFSRHFNTAGHLNSTPCRTDSPISHLKNNDQCVESVKHLLFENEINEQEKIFPVGIGSSICLTMGPSTVPLEEEEQILPAIEHLNLDDSSSGSNEESPIQMQEKSQIEETEPCVSSQSYLSSGCHLKAVPQKPLWKKLTPQNPDSKPPKMKPCLKSAVQPTKRKTTAEKTEKTSSSQPPTSTTIYNKSSPDLTRKVTSIRTKRQATVNPKVAPYDKVKTSTDPNKLKSSTSLKKTLGGKSGPALGTQRPSELSLKLEENSIKSLTKQKHPPKAVSPDVIIHDTLEKTPQTNMKAPLEEKVKALSKSTKPVSTVKRKVLKGSTKSLPVETPLHESKLGQSLPQPGPQVDSKPTPVSSEEIKTKADTVETLPEPSVKKKQTKGIHAATSNQVSSLPTSAARTKRRSLDSLATSTVTIRRQNTLPRPKTTDTSCDSKAIIDLAPVTDKTKKPVSSKWKKQRRRAFVVPTSESDDVTVVDLEPLSPENVQSLPELVDPIFEKQVTTRTKRRCPVKGSTNLSIENSFATDDLADSTVSLDSHSTSEGDHKHTTVTKRRCRSVGSASSFTEGSLEMVVPSESEDTIPSLVADKMTSENISKGAKGKRMSRRSMGCVPEEEPQNVGAGEAPPLSEPVKILDNSVLAVQSQSQAPLRRSTRRRSIELSLSLNSNQKQIPVAAQSNNKTPTPTRSADRKVTNDDDEDERLREIYAKKPYVPISPSRLETIYSPNKKRECSLFGKRKFSRAITFQPSETRLKNRRKKAMRNWPFLFEVPDVDEKLYKLLNIA